MAIPLKENDPGMPEPSERLSSADVPTYDTYPAELPRTRGWRPPGGRLSTPEHNPRLDESAERIGSLVGDAVNRGREALRRFDSMKAEAGRSSKSKVQEFSDRAEEKWSEARDAAKERFDEFRESAQKSAQNAKQMLAEKTREARVRAKNYTNENPHHILLGIAGLAFAIGLTARLMRRSRD